MNTNLRALLFGAIVADTMIATLSMVFAAEPRASVVRTQAPATARHALVDAHRDVEVIRLEPVTVTARKDTVAGA